MNAGEAVLVILQELFDEVKKTGWSDSQSALPSRPANQVVGARGIFERELPTQNKQSLQVNG